MLQFPFSFSATLLQNTRYSSNHQKIFQMLELRQTETIFKISAMLVCKTTEVFVLEEKKYCWCLTNKHRK